MKKVQDALSPLNIPIFAGAWHKTPQHPKAPDKYLVYTTFTTERDFADDEHDGYHVYVYLNLWTRSDPTADILAVRRAMRAAGFAMSDERDSYHDDVDMTLIAWTWVIREVREDAVQS